MKRKMEFPDDVLDHIRGFAKPLGLRLDWRTCKRKESRRIKGSNLALLLWYKWFLGQGPLYTEIEKWSFYGRRHLLYESRLRFWSHVQGDPTEEDPEWYEKQFMRYPLPHSPFPMEVHMADVSLIV